MTGIRKDPHTVQKNKDIIDGGRFNLSPDNEAGPDDFFDEFGRRTYSNDPSLWQLYSNTAKQTLQDRGQMRQLRREARQERRDFRRQERNDYRERKQKYKEDLANWESRQARSNTALRKPEKPQRVRYDEYIDAGKARRLGGRDYLNSYLAYRYANDVVENELKEHGMQLQPNAWFADDNPLKPQEHYGVVEYTGSGQDYLDNNREYIESNIPYFLKRAKKEAEGQADIDYANAVEQYGNDKNAWVDQRHIQLLKDQARGQRLDEQFDDADVASQYEQTHPYPIKQKARIRFTEDNGQRSEGVSTDRGTAVDELYPDLDPRYVYALKLNPGIPISAYDENTGTQRPYTYDELYKLLAPWVKSNWMYYDRYNDTPGPHDLIEQEAYPKAEPTHTPDWYFKPSYLKDDNQLSRGGRLRVPKRNSYGDRVTRADNLGTDEYDVYF